MQKGKDEITIQWPFTSFQKNWQYKVSDECNKEYEEWNNNIKNM